MDDKVNDFLNEIDEIAPPLIRPEQEEVWKQCYDELTGYVYYWNKKTDKVTWTPPKCFKETGAQVKKKQNIPTKLEPLFPAVKTNPKDVPKDIKIYSIGENSKKFPVPPKVSRKSPKKKFNSDSEDEKITLISSYGSDSESEENEYTEAKKLKTESHLSPKKTFNSEEEEDIDILVKIQRKTQELQALGGDIPAEVKTVVENSKAELLKSVKPLPEVSLVAGYSDSEEETDPKEEPPQISHSPLFPITKPINLEDFKSPKPIETNVNVENTDNFDNKAFQRKRRIGIALVNTGKRTIDNDEETRTGLGFDKSNKTNDLVYSGLKKDGIAFVKSETLIPANNRDNIIENENKSKNLEAVNDMYLTLKEKLTFLNEGRPDISPVQLMLIQAETLLLAMNDGALKQSYLQKWLKETCSELIKLEKEATPSGWMLQWDKSHKRYFYQNSSTGESQWEYPQPDISTCDDAMDISTTPPHHVDSEPNVPMSPPLPPPISSPTPPPPPIISSVDQEVNYTEVPLPKEPEPRKSVEVGVEPLPPGVDKHEMATFVKPKDDDESDQLNSALDSFYSDIAAISASPPPPPSQEELSSDNPGSEIKSDIVKKKKKPKVRLAPGLAMKKKGVSKLVEKWKNLQQEYN